MGYIGSEEFIRLQFEEYLLSLISSVKCHNYLLHHANNPNVMLPQVDGDPSTDFGADWIEAWSRSENYRIWDRNTDSHLFDIVEPKHPCAGGLTIDDVQRRIAEQVKDLHLDERFAVGKEVLGKNLEAGREKVSTVFNKLYSDMEALRESQKRKQEESKRESERNGLASPGLPKANIAQSKAGAYIGSWGTWVGEKRKVGWGRSSSTNTAPTVASKKENDKPPIVEMPREKEKPRPTSYNESLFDAEESAPLAAKSKPRPMSTSRFHEIIDDPPKPILLPRKPLSPANESPPKVEVQVLPLQSEEAAAWAEANSPAGDVHARSQAVADAVEAEGAK